MGVTELAVLDDEALVARAVNGDRAALENLLQRHARLAFTYAFSVLGRREDALDAAQTALLQMAREVSAGGQRASFKACLYVCAHNAAVNLMQSNASRIRREAQAPRGTRLLRCW
jgi:RNA polymerase sigma-70 factor, ECF subfamily